MTPTSRPSISRFLLPCAMRFGAVALLPLLLGLLFTGFSGMPVHAQSEETRDLPRADIVNPEGGAVSVKGVLTYTNAFFTVGTAAPMIIMEDQAGFIDRNSGFLLPIESQTLGQITSDFYRSPISYTLSLPIEPQGSLRDVDNDGEDDVGVMVFAIAYWTNIFGDPFLEERDLLGGGWSTAYASTRVSDQAEIKRELIGGKLLVYAPDDRQGFPADFGPDGLLFTGDEDAVRLPQGYTVVDMDVQPFRFERTRYPRIDLLEPATVALVDFSQMEYVAAFDALVDLLRKEYAFTEFKEIDWDALRTEFRPRFEDAGDDSLLYRRALRDFAFAIPDGHVNGPFVVQDFNRDTAGGLGMAIREVDDGSVLVNFLLPDGPAAAAGIELGAEIIAIDGVPIDEHVDSTLAYSAPFSTEHYARLQRLRYAVRTQLGTAVEITVRNPDASETTTVSVTASGENESFNFSSFNAGLDGFELPLRYEQLSSGHGYVQLYGFSDNRLLTIQLWERLIRTLNDEGIPGLIIDLRQNGGGSNFLADQMAAYFFDEPLELGNTGFYDDALDAFFFDPLTAERFYPPPDDLRYDGALAVLIGPNCSSACEFFAYNLTLNGRAAIVGQYPTAGLGGSIDVVRMPEGELFQYTAGRAVDVDGNIHIEGQGVAPTIRVPVDARTLFSNGDPVLDAAVAYATTLTAIDVIDGGPLTVGDVVSGRLTPGARVRYSLAVSAGEVLDIYLEDATSQLDTVLRIYDLADNLLGFNDDAESRGTVNSAIEHLEIPIDLTLVLEVATYQDSDGGGYILSVLPGTPLPTIDAQTAPPDMSAEPDARAADDSDTNARAEEPTTDAVPPESPTDGDTGASASDDAAAEATPEAVTASGNEAAAPATVTLPTPTATPPTAVAGPELPTPTMTPTRAPTPSVPRTVTVRTEGARLSVRSGPGVEFRRIGWVRDGQTVAVIELSADEAWMRVIVDDLDEGASGWISTTYVELQE